MAKPRNYQSEYLRRIERALAKGLSRSQARGHAKGSETPIRPKPRSAQLDNARIEAALRTLRARGHITSAARENRISPERLRRELLSEGLAKRSGRRWIITDDRPRQVVAYTTTGVRLLVLPGYEATSPVGRHTAAVPRFLRTQDLALLDPFKGMSVRDVEGKLYELETDPNALYMLHQMGDEVFEQVYRIVAQG